MTIIVDRDLILKIGNLPLIFHPGAFAELGIREIFGRELKKQQDVFETAIFREKRTANIGKSWLNKYFVKISGQNPTLFEKVNS